MNKKMLLIGFFFSGMTALLYEVIWMRPLTIIFGSTTYAISTVLSAFMAGLALGSYISSKHADKIKNPLKVFAIIHILIGIYGIVIINLFNYLPQPYIWIWNTFNLNLTMFIIIQFLLCFAVLLIPTTLMGAAWPIVNKGYNKKDEVGKDTGTLYSVNSVGAIIGSSIAGFILIPTLGIKWASIVTAIINLMLGIIMWFVSKRK